MGKVTIRDVAAAAGVSRQTVSRVINDKPDVATETRQRVLDVIEQLQYRPSNIARSLTQGRSYTLGVIGYGMQYFGPAHTLAGLEHQANELGYTLHLSMVREPTEGGVQLLHELVSYHVDGIIWAVFQVGDNRNWSPEEICQVRVPVVFVDTTPCPGLSVVNVDNRRGGRLATAHLLEQGCRRVGIITGPLHWWAAHQRMLGWRDALEEAGLSPDDDAIVDGSWSPSSGERALHKLLERCPDVDGVFASNDQMALGAFRAALERGRRIPEDLAVVGFDDIPEAAFFRPPLSTIRQDLNELGRVAVKELGRLIEASHDGQGDVAPRAITLQPELIVRDSSIKAEVSRRTRQRTPRTRVPGDRG